MTMGLLSLHSDHVVYLRERGLNDETIMAAEFYSARPGDLPRLAGRPIPDGTSGMVIPYPGSGGFLRVRLFPPIPLEDGKVQKFGQPNGSGVRAYICPGTEATLQNPSASLCVVEGEVKALALTQAGFLAIGLGGVWNFRAKDLPEDGLISDLEAVTWEGRIVYLTPDSDGWRNEQVLLGVYRLARLLEARGATVLIVKLPDLPDFEKTGADDFLVKKGTEAFRRLLQKAVTLVHPAFRPFRLREAQEKAKAPAVPEELRGRRIEPGLTFDIEARWAALHIVRAVEQEDVRGERVFLVTSERKLYPSLGFADPAFVGRWPAEQLQAFLKGETPQGFTEPFVLLVDKIQRLVELPRPGDAAVLAAWVLATYFYKLFPAFPYLAFIGEMGTGKTKVLEILALTALNARLIIDPTPAVLFRLLDDWPGALLFDEVETLTDGEQRAELKALLNAGYRRGGLVYRCEGEEHEPIAHCVYGPKVLAGIREPNGVTLSRAIPFPMKGAEQAEVRDVGVDPGQYSHRGSRQNKP